MENNANDAPKNQTGEHTGTPQSATGTRPAAAGGDGRAREKNTFEAAYLDLQSAGFNVRPDPLRLRLPQPRMLLWAGLRWFCGDRAQWLPEYEEVARWLADNRGQGLFLQGACGRGKSLIGWKILPVIIHRYYRKIVECSTAVDMNRRTELLLSRHLLYIDDVGTEQERNHYGTKSWAFPEIVDEAERKGHLLIFSSNLSIQELGAKYGRRTIDRLTAVARRVEFSGKSMR